MKKVLICIFISICLLPVFIMLFFPHIDKNYENRPLAAFPDKLTKNITVELQDYFSDNFGLRTTFISLNSLLYYNLLHESSNAKVIAGKDGWLFFKDTIGDYTGTAALSESGIHRIYRTLHQMSEYLKSRNIRMYFTVAPNKNSIYGEYMPGRYTKRKTVSNLEVLENILIKNDFPYIDIHNALLSGKTIGQLYHKKDTHWNNRGAYIAFAKIAEALGKNVQNIEELQYTTAKDYFGDLQKMLTPAFKIYDEQIYLKTDYTFTYTKHMKSFDDLVIETSSSGEKNLVMLRDSFAVSLIPLFSGVFQNAAYLRQFPYDLTAAAAYEPDYMVIEIAERNLPTLLNGAPVFTASPVMEGSFSGLEYVPLDTDISVKQNIDDIKITGSAPLDDIFEIYVRLTGPDESVTFEAVTFNSDRKDRTGFSLMMDKDDLPVGDLAIEVICVEKSKTFVCYMEDVFSMP
jgi:hypothetical protein